MAARLVGSRVRVVAYMPSLQVAVRHFRAFCTYDEQQPRMQPDLTMNFTESQTVWPDKRLGPLGPQDKRFPLPGLTGTNITKTSAAQQMAAPAQECDLFTALTPQERQAVILEQYFSTDRQDAEEQAQANIAENPGKDDILECAATDCPRLLKKDFQELFPDRNLSQGQLTVITISQKTQHDMTGWSPEVEEEREDLLEHFVNGAQDICHALHDAGYWADFIDPSSGRPYMGAYTNATLYETDERYKNFGFDIEDLGCCKVIRHALWGTNAYVGCLFTNAPVDHPVIQDMTLKVHKD